MAKYSVYHTHVNPEFGKKRDAPMLVVIEGRKEDCAKCKKQEDLNLINARRINIKGVRGQ